MSEDPMDTNTLRLIAIHVGQPRQIPKGEGTVLTSIRKSSVPAAGVHRLGVEGDTISAPKFHGGVDQAVYVYSLEDYEWWNTEGHSFAPGAFGENFVFDTFGGDVMVGDRFSVGSVTLEATGPRTPCWKLAQEVEIHDMVKQFRAAGRPGFYTRVIQEGTVTAGDEVVRTSGGHDVSINELFELNYVTNPSKADSFRVLNAPVASRLRDHHQARLEKGS